MNKLLRFLLIFALVFGFVMFSNPRPLHASQMNCSGITNQVDLVNCQNYNLEQSNDSESRTQNMIVMIVIGWVLFLAT